MSRCDYDSIFYRVFCVTLLGIAFTFTVILTNVFIDIDGLLSKKDHGNTEKPKETVTPESMTDNEVYQGDQLETRTEVFQGEEIEKKADLYGMKADREDDEENYRTKRALDIQKFQYRVNNPKIKEILNNKLATLLEELDAKETHTTKTKEAEEHKPEETLYDNQNALETATTAVKPQDDMLHLAMHNILLQGIIGHMDLNDVYKKVHELVYNFDTNDKKTGGELGNFPTGDINSPAQAIGQLFKSKLQKQFSQEVMNPQTSHTPSSLETMFFEELLKCEKLQKQLDAASQVKLGMRRSTTHNTDKKALPKVLIRTVIDIKTLKTSNDSKSYFNSNNIKGLIKLIYNGKPIEFSPMKEDEIFEEDQLKPTPEPKFDAVKVSEDNKEEENGDLVDTYIDKALTQYLRKYPQLESKFKNKRLKRHAKHSKSKTHKKPDNSKEDEELYIEIETNFDGKGIKGNKKKKLIEQLVEKIRKAIHSQIDSYDKTKKDKKETVMQIKKRFQNPLKPKSNEFLSKIIMPFDKFVLRELEPISKVVKLPQSIPLISNSFGAGIGNIDHKSGFLSDAKSINSGEMGTVRLEFDKVSNENGIPQRLQKSLNSDNINDPNNYDNMFNLGNLKFYVKEKHDGTGLSIGFNQYVAEAPDSENMKLFTGLQQLIYGDDKNYDVNNIYIDDQKEGRENVNFNENNHELRKRDAQQISKNQNNGPIAYYTNEYKVFFDNNFQPYDSYSQVFEDVDKKVSLSIVKDPTTDSKHPNAKTKSLLPLIIDESIFAKQLNPSEIFSLANMFDRKKRAVKIINYTKTKVNHYLNTIRMAKFNQKRRPKRQVDKIRIIASDSLPRTSRRINDDNIFIVSDDDNIYADRAIVRDQEREREAEDAEQDTDQEDRHEYVLPTKLYNDNYNPYTFNTFAQRARQNSLMSKYPHLFLEEIPQSKEETSNSFYKKLLNGYADPKKEDSQKLPYMMPSAMVDPIMVESGSMNYDDPTKPNYKLTVKIIPKNNSEDAGFKEMHTSINKSVHKNGLVYSSQVNVTELSKVENLNPVLPNQTPFRNVDINEMDEKHTPLINPLTESSKSYVPLVQHIKEQQARMKELLKKHKQRIDDQLVTLKQEKLNLDSVIVPYEKKVETIDVLLPLNPPQMLHLNKDEAGQLIAKALMKLHSTPQLNDILTNNLTRQNLSEHLPEITTAQPVPTTVGTTLDPEKERILRTIQRNENLTSTILNKIDRNTNLLQMFLNNLAERMTPIAPAHTYLAPDQKPLKGPFHEPDLFFRHMHEPFFGQSMPGLEMRKNATHLSIPFVYAYQQPYPLNNKPNSPLASVVYQGHIHTNAYNNLKNIDAINPPSEKTEVNRTRFFMDGTDGGMVKMIPATLRKKPYEITRMRNNITQGIPA